VSTMIWLGVHAANTSVVMDDNSVGGAMEATDPPPRRPHGSNKEALELVLQEWHGCGTA
jgi:hypothetical protein